MKRLFWYGVVFLMLSLVGLCSYQQYNMSNLVENHVPQLFTQKVDKILVLKSKRKMYLQHQGDVIKEYDIDLGGNPIGHKQQRGDKKTPEGLYKISFRNAKSKFFLSLRISYPNAEDIKRSQENNVDPGSDIMIHGLPNRISKVFLPRDWTSGCIAVRSNEDMLEIWDNVTVNTPVEILP